MNPFYDEIFRWWNIRLKPGQKVLVVEDSDEEESDFRDFMVVKSDPYDQCGSEASPPPKASEVWEVSKQHLKHFC